jgi:hypothetical protein
MQRITTATAFVDKWGPGANGFTDGNQAAGTPSTQLNAAWFDQLQEEVASAIQLGLGIPPTALDPADRTQLYQAIQAIAGASNPDLSSFVRRSGDIMTGALRIESTLNVTGGVGLESFVNVLGDLNVGLPAVGNISLGAGGAYLRGATQGDMTVGSGLTYLQIDMTGAMATNANTLHVNGQAGTGQVNPGTGGGYVMGDPLGNLSLGTAAPAGVINVNGNTFLQGSLGLSNDVGGFINVSGYDPAALGAFGFRVSGTFNYSVHINGALANSIGTTAALVVTAGGASINGDVNVGQTVLGAVGDGRLRLGGPGVIYGITGDLTQPVAFQVNPGVSLTVWHNGAPTGYALFDTIFTDEATALRAPTLDALAAVCDTPVGAYSIPDAEGGIIEVPLGFLTETPSASAAFLAGAIQQLAARLAALEASARTPPPQAAATRQGRQPR